MVVISNPRKLVQNGSSIAVNLPPEILEAVGLEKGDRVVLESDGDRVTMEEVEFRRATDE